MFELLQQSKDHRDIMNQLLQIIEIDINNPESFATFVGNFKKIQKFIIVFYDHELKDTKVI